MHLVQANYAHLFLAVYLKIAAWLTYKYWRQRAQLEANAEHSVAESVSLNSALGAQDGSKSGSISVNRTPSHSQTEANDIPLGPHNKPSISLTPSDVCLSCDLFIIPCAKHIWALQFISLHSRLFVHELQSNVADKLSERADSKDDAAVPVAGDVLPFSSMRVIECIAHE